MGTGQTYTRRAERRSEAYAASFITSLEEGKRIYGTQFPVIRPINAMIVIKQRTVTAAITPWNSGG